MVATLNKVLITQKRLHLEHFCKIRCSATFSMPTRWYHFSVRSRARFREFVHTLGRVVAKPTHQRVCAVATRRNTQN